MVLYAVVDVETTGSRPRKASMTEIAIVVTDGQRVLEEWSTLLKPTEPIPPDIVRLTGITQNMAAQAPDFATVADQVHQMLKDKVFVAHHAEFDYGFVKEALKGHGVEWSAERVCTSRLFRKLYGERRSSLAYICSVLGVRNERPHRALPDAMATAQIFIKMVGDYARRLGRMPGARDFRSFRDNTPGDPLPAATGVYYLLNEAGRVEYVGKAKNIAQRVKQHFNDTEKGRVTSRVHWKVTYSEWLALIVEDAEIQRLWPRLNSAQRKLPTRYGLLSYTDGRGNIRLAIDKLQKHQVALAEFFSFQEARQFLLSKVRQYELNASLCGASPDRLTEYDEVHNTRCKALLDELSTAKKQDRDLTGWLRLTDTDDRVQAYLAFYSGLLVGYALCRGGMPGVSYLHRLKPGVLTPYYLRMIFSQSDSKLFIRDAQLAAVLEAL
ncbi:exonuclease domain-containing protein [Schleiferia thermophila]|uniref:exonuclease domain-containing protein n=1 Tax=Schleiferia thermophila TaxID=884107 RepID=UPI003EE95635